MREAGLRTSRASVGDPDPVVAVMDVWDPMKFDEIIVSTLPTGSSRWMGLDLPHRLEKLTSVPVRHVVSKPPQPEAPTGPAPEHPQKMGVLAALSRAGHPPLARSYSVVAMARRPADGLAMLDHDRLAPLTMVCSPSFSTCASAMDEPGFSGS